jgi:hypothetical protein
MIIESINYFFCLLIFFSTKKIKKKEAKTKTERVINEFRLDFNKEAKRKEL